MPQPRPELAELSPVLHGGAREPGRLDFSTGVSPLPTPPAILEAARGADLSRYPDPTAAPLRAALAEMHGCSTDEVVAGAGSVELIWALARAFGGPGRRGVVFAPAFGEYEQALRASGARVERIVAPPPRFDWTRAELPDADGSGPALVFICRPSNPCLTVVSADFVAGLAARFPRALVVVDEAYLPMFDDVAPVARGGNIAILRSLTKVFALPGLRIGYLLAAPTVARAVQSCLPPWNVSSPAQAAGAVAARLLPDEAPRVRGAIRDLRDDLEHGLATHGLHAAAKGGPFLLYEISGGAPALCRTLDARGVHLRDCTSFGLPDHVRIGARPREEQARLLALWPVAP